ncbi:YciI family protein [Patulibacter sp. NPDC049589]|uniref:YciI family protein n=1 Tax=Patulibacter sp. NPDC049589 TaxID=3154731 RepID=UPI00343CF0E3
MRFMVIIKASADSEAGVMPSTELLTAMGAYNEELVNAGVMLGGDGLHPSSKGARVTIAPDGAATVVDGPFAETKELVAGFWIWQLDSLDEAVAWAKRIPCDATGSEPGHVEIRQIFSPEDFGAELTPELRAQEDELREKIEGQ